MKNLLMTTAMLLLSLSSYAQQRNFDGLWTGTMTKSDGETYSLKLFIEDNNVYAVTTDDDDLVKDRYKEVSVSKGYGQQLNFMWIDKGGVWTETHMYSISWKNDNEISIHMIRHVSNESSDYDGNTDWGYYATGVLESY